MGNLAALLLEEQRGETMRLRKKGDKATIAMLLRAAMDTDKEVAAACLTAALSYCQEKGIDCGQLGSLVGGKSG